MNKLLYVGYYDTAEDHGQDRNYVLSAANKMTYICSAINRTGRPVEIVSASRTQNKRGCPGRRATVLPQTELVLFPSVGTGGLFKRVMRTIAANWHLGMYLFRHTRRGEPLLVYHSMGYVRLIWWLKKLKGFRLILEVEEIYADVTGDEDARRWEHRLFRAADAYIFPTELLDERLNGDHAKPSCVIYGTYQVEPDRGERFDDGRIHLLYAGTLDPRKGGTMAVALAEHLPEDYHVHILGFGSQEDKDELLGQIDRLKADGKANVTYDGLLSGEEYIRFVQRCHIGLSTQMPDASFNETSFPSKVLSYLANGLRVVSVRLRSLERASICPLLSFYSEHSGPAIAQAVTALDLTAEYDSRAAVEALNKQFEQSVDQLLNGI